MADIGRWVHRPEEVSPDDDARFRAEWLEKQEAQRDSVRKSREAEVVRAALARAAKESYWAELAERRAQKSSEVAARHQRKRAYPAPKAPPSRWPGNCFLFPDARSRRAWTLDRRREGMTFRAIGLMLGVCAEMASYLVRRAEQEMIMHRNLRPRAPLATLVDPGGPRDVWLEFYPPPDPRFDNMVPVMADG